MCILDNNTSTQRMQRCAHNEPPLFFSFFFKGSLYNDNKSSWVSKKKRKDKQTHTHTHSSSFACFALAGACNKHRALSPSLISKQGKTTGDDGKTLRCAKATRRCSLHAVVVIIELPCFFSFFIARGHLAVVVPFFFVCECVAEQRNMRYRFVTYGYVRRTPVLGVPPFQFLFFSVGDRKKAREKKHTWKGMHSLRFCETISFFVPLFQRLLFSFILAVILWKVPFFSFVLLIMEKKKQTNTSDSKKKIQVHKKVTGMLMFSLTFLYTTSLVFFFGVFIISRFWQCYPRR